MRIRPPVTQRPLRPIPPHLLLIHTQILIFLRIPIPMISNRMQPRGLIQPIHLRIANPTPMASHTVDLAGIVLQHPLDPLDLPAPLPILENFLQLHFILRRVDQHPLVFILRLVARQLGLVLLAPLLLEPRHLLRPLKIFLVDHIVAVDPAVGVGLDPVLVLRLVLIQREFPRLQRHVICGCCLGIEPLLLVDVADPPARRQVVVTCQLVEGAILSPADRLVPVEASRLNMSLRPPVCLRWVDHRSRNILISPLMRFLFSHPLLLPLRTFPLLHNPPLPRPYPLSRHCPLLPDPLLLHLLHHNLPRRHLFILTHRQLPIQQIHVPPRDLDRIQQLHTDLPGHLIRQMLLHSRHMQNLLTARPTLRIHLQQRLNHNLQILRPCLRHHIAALEHLLA